MNQSVCREGAFSSATREQVRQTLLYLRYCHQVARELPENLTVAVPGRENRGFRMNRQEAARRLQEREAEAILRKAGSLPPLNHRGQPCRKWDAMEQIRMTRDCYRVRERVTRRVRVYQFETEEVRRRFGHLLSRYDD